MTELASGPHTVWFRAIRGKARSRVRREGPDFPTWWDARRYSRDHFEGVSVTAVAIPLHEVPWDYSSRKRGVS